MGRLTQGSLRRGAAAATLGWGPERRWRSSSVRSAIFVAVRPIRFTKLRRSGIKWCDGDMPPRWGWELFLDAGFYKDAAPTGLAHRPPGEIPKSPSQLEAEIQQAMKELKGMLN